MYRSVFFHALVILSLSNGALDAAASKIFASIDDVPQAVWDQLAEKKIFFGHQSVGYNILDGVEQLKHKYPQIRLTVIESRTAPKSNDGMLLHAPVGQNMHPVTKINDFAELMNSGLGSEMDAAFFKFCYIDFNPGTDVDKVFNAYTEQIEQIRRKNPKLRLIHVTAPLTAMQGGLKGFIKKIIGKPLEGYDDNKVRARFNKMLVDKYSGQDPIFDLATVESTYPDGKREFFDSDGEKIYAMVSDYTDDGGHLNKTGQLFVAEKFLLFLANTL